MFVEIIVAAKAPISLYLSSRTAKVLMTLTLTKVQRSIFSAIAFILFADTETADKIDYFITIAN